MFQALRIFQQNLRFCMCYKTLTKARKINKVHSINLPLNIYYGLLLPVVLANYKPHSKLNAQQLIDQCDDYYKTKDYDSALNILKQLQNGNEKDVDILWRITRCLYQLSKSPTLNSEESKKLIHEAYNIIEQAIQINDSNGFVHKWMAVILDAKVTLEGTKAKISSLKTFQYHLKRAVELNPNDATSFYMLGLYCFSIADLPWYQRKLAETLFAKMPDESYEDALQFFLKAEEIDPNFYCENLLMLGKTYMRLKLPDSAKHWLQRAANYPTQEDENARKEAAQLLKTLS